MQCVVREVRVASTHATSGCTSRTARCVLSRGVGDAPLSTTTTLRGGTCWMMERTVSPISASERWHGITAPMLRVNPGSFFHAVGFRGRGVNTRRNIGCSLREVGGDWPARCDGGGREQGARRYTMSASRISRIVERSVG